MRLTEPSSWSFGCVLGQDGRVNEWKIHGGDGSAQTMRMVVQQEQAAVSARGAARRLDMRGDDRAGRRSASRILQRGQPLACDRPSAGAAPDHVSHAVASQAAGGARARRLCERTSNLEREPGGLHFNITTPNTRTPTSPSPSVLSTALFRLLSTSQRRPRSFRARIASPTPVPVASGPQAFHVRRRAASASSAPVSICQVPGPSPIAPTHQEDTFVPHDGRRVRRKAEAAVGSAAARLSSLSAAPHRARRRNALSAQDRRDPTPSTWRTFTSRRPARR